jgi:hypothetical protein
MCNTKHAEELKQLENQFNEVSDWLLNNNMLHPKWEEKEAEFKRLDNEIENLLFKMK